MLVQAVDAKAKLRIRRAGHIDRKRSKSHCELIHGTKACVQSMVAKAWISIGICLAALLFVLALNQRSRNTIGLPTAYMISLLLIHVPGAYAFAVSGGEYTGILAGGTYPAEGIFLTAIGSVCFAVGLRFVSTRPWRPRAAHGPDITWIDRRFLYFCLIGGWVFAFGLTPLKNIPTVGAAINFGSAIWMLAVIIGLWGAVVRGDNKSLCMWIAALIIYPVSIFTFGGFLSYGAAAVIIVCSIFLVNNKKYFKSILTIILFAYMGISIFVNYYESRTELRSVLWSGAGVEQRASAIYSAFSGFSFFNSNNPGHMDALAQRLNQNEFVGLSAYRLEHGYVEYLNGRSFFEGMIAPIPRLLWPGKPVYGGSPKVVAEMTGLQFNTWTSWGVGNVMEFYINFGLPSLIGGFVLLGSVIGWLDRKASMALFSSKPYDSFRFFLPGVALIQPNGSLVELVGGAFAAILAAFFWKQAWLEYSRLVRIRAQKRVRVPYEKHR